MARCNAYCIAKKCRTDTGSRGRLGGLPLLIPSSESDRAFPFDFHHFFTFSLVNFGFRVPFAAQFLLNIVLIVVVCSLFLLSFLFHFDYSRHFCFNCCVFHNAKRVYFHSFVSFRFGFQRFTFPFRSFAVSLNIPSAIHHSGPPPLFLLSTIICLFFFVLNDDRRGDACVK